MGRIIRMQRRPTNSDAAGGTSNSTRAIGADHDRIEATITQALFMVRLYVEVLAMDEMVIKRIRQLVATQPDGVDREDSLNTMRLAFAQFEKVGQRIGYWKARLRSLLKGQLSKTAARTISEA
jgi:hypothetical protein